MQAMEIQDAHTGKHSVWERYINLVNSADKSKMNK